ncbi:MAG: aryl-sulfate sulfohydrolase [Planctomycetes bacterium]|jgi:arylsulfatase A-like enzyme|nr:aryl-sulfate sulfohydrolase [Planctomycetota bacterium]
MTRAAFLISVLLGGVAAAQKNDTADTVATKRPPNFVFVLADDLGCRDTSFTGSRYYETPHLDQLAKQGMVFTQAYANAPNCAPTRACLMSGQYGPRHGIYTVGNAARGKRENRKLVPIENVTTLRDEILTLPELLSANSYKCGHFGKWHLGKDPKAQGFHVNVGGNKRGAPGRGGYYSPYRNRDLPDGPKDEYLTDRLTDEALKFIDDNRGGPFFLYLSHYAVHTPIEPKPGKVGKYRGKKPDGGHKNPKYAAMIESLDESVGRVVQKLDRLQLADNTVLVFFSDNGGHGRVTSHEPLRGAKGMLYEGGVRVPMIVRWPGHVQPGSTTAQPVIGIDFFPTFLEIGGIAKPEDKLLDGVSLLPILKGGEVARRDLFWHFPAYLEGNRRRGTWRTTPVGVIRSDNWKLLEFFEEGRLELYDLAKDPNETTNLAADRRPVTERLLARMKEWRRATSAPVPTEPNPGYRDR